MVRSKKFTALIDSLQSSLNNCQYENLGRPFDKDAQLAFGANWYGTMTEFVSELDEMFLTTDQGRIRRYVKDTYEEFTRFGVLFKMLVEDYEQRLTGNGRSKLSSDTYGLVYAYLLAIEDTANQIRRDADEYLALSLIPFQKLTLDSYNINGRFIEKLAQDGKIRDFKTFTDIFFNPADLEICVEALRRIRPDAPIISDTGNWEDRSGSKAILAAWIKRMQDCNKIHFFADKKQLVPLLNAFFPNLNFGVEARTLKEPDSDIVREFAALILP